MDEATREYLEERAAIREYEGGYSRAEAEKLARRDLKEKVECYTYGWDNLE